MADARQRIAEWKEDYNQIRPHSALGPQLSATTVIAVILPSLKSVRRE
jgi:transposase InsO family protein